METKINIGEIRAEVVLKDIKNIHLSVYPPCGSVRIAAPCHMELETIRVFALAKLPWIRRQQRKLCNQEREAARDFIDRESHYFKGRRYLLKVVESDTVPTVEIKHNQLVLSVRPGTDTAKRQSILDEWYRQSLKDDAQPLLTKWEGILGVKASRVTIRRMKTRWGSCNHKSKAILINLELAKKPPECLEYIIVHELAHLREPTHNAKFVAILDRHLPKWHTLRDELNRLPVRHEHWDY